MIYFGPFHSQYHGGRKQCACYCDTQEFTYDKHRIIHGKRLNEPKYASGDCSNNCHCICAEAVEKRNGLTKQVRLSIYSIVLTDQKDCSLSAERKVLQLDWTCRPLTPIFHFPRKSNWTKYKILIFWLHYSWYWLWLALSENTVLTIDTSFVLYIKPFWSQRTMLERL